MTKLIDEKEMIVKRIKKEDDIDNIHYCIRAFKEAEIKQLALKWLQQEFGL